VRAVAQQFRRVGVEQGERRDGLALRLQLPRHLEGRDAAERPAPEPVRPRGLRGAQGFHVVGGHRLDIRVRLPARQKVARAETVKRLLRAEAACQVVVAEGAPAHRVDTEERRQRPPRLDGDEQRAVGRPDRRRVGRPRRHSARLLSSIAERLGDLPRHLAEGVVRGLLSPALRDPGVNAAVLMKFHVPEHLRERVDAVRHALLLVAVGLHHLGVKLKPEETAQAFERPARVAHQLLEPQTVLTRGGHLRQKLSDVLLADEPDEFGQLAPGEGMGVAEKDLFQFGLFERPNHAEGVAQEVDV
jgi:hypothetical protein